MSQYHQRQSAQAARLLQPRSAGPAHFSATCHACQVAEEPFAVRLDRGRWLHTCGAAVCPACGGQPAADHALCLTCQALARAAREKRQRKGRR